MSATVIGIIVCIAMVICGIGCFFIGRTMGMEYVHEHSICIRMVDGTKGGEDEVGQND